MTLFRLISQDALKAVVSVSRALGLCSASLSTIQSWKESIALLICAH